MARNGSLDLTNDIELDAITQGGQGVDVDTSPDGGYGWVVVASCFTLNGFTWGVTSVSAYQFQRLSLQSAYGLFG
jgi:hypothetical protein